MTRKGDVIQNLIELSKWRKQLKYMTKLTRGEGTMADRVKYIALALDAVDNGFANLTATVQAIIKPRPRRPKKML
jgi:hypothetical protein